MAVEDVVTDLPSMTAPVVHPEPGSTTNALSGTRLPPDATGETGDDNRSPRGIRVIGQIGGEEPSLLVEIRISELPRWMPRMDFDQPRDLTDDE
jgi:hypothetical protein